MRRTTARLWVVPLLLPGLAVQERQPPPLELAIAEHGRPPEREDRVRIPEIAVLVGNEIVLDGIHMTLATAEDTGRMRRATRELSESIPRIPDEHVSTITYPDRPVLVSVDGRVPYDRAGSVLDMLGLPGIALTLVELEVVVAETGEPAWLHLSQPMDVGINGCRFGGEDLELRLVSPGAPPIALYWYMEESVAERYHGETTLSFESIDGVLAFLEGGRVAAGAKHFKVMPSPDATWQSVVEVLDALAGAEHSVELAPLAFLEHGQRSPK